MGTRFRLDGRDVRMTACGAALGIAVIGIPMTVSHIHDGAALPASSAQIEDAVGRLAPNCQMVARRGLRQSLDHSRRAWISMDDLERLTGPLARGGSEACETINEQRFGLGEV